jgi:hypothetical protein
MFDIDKDTALVVLWGATILLVGWTWFPAIVSALGGARYSLRGIERTGYEFPAPDDLIYEVWATQLQQLGYEGVGVGAARVEFLEDQWRVEGQFRVFHSIQKQVYVLVQKMPDPWRIWREVTFITRLSDSGLVMTRNVPARPSGEETAVIQQGVESNELAEVENLHLETVEKLRRRGQRAESDSSLEGLLHALEEAARPAVRANAAHLGKRFLALHFIIHGCISLPAAYYAGLGHWGLPLTNLVLAVVMRIGETAQKRQTAYAMAQKLRARQSARGPRR